MIWWRIAAAPLAWICIVWVIVLVLVVAFDSGAQRRLLWANVAAALLAVAIVEAALYVTGPRNPYLLPDGVRFVGDLARPDYFIEIPTLGLGYQPRPGISVRAIKEMGANTIYDVRYSVGADGLRLRPATVGEPSGCFLMFGDSVAWGEGVNDEDTAAYQVGVLSGGTLAVANFAFTGYSAHQMLWQISSGMVTERSGCDGSKPVTAVYQTLGNNVGRVAGLRGWDRYGPRYVLGRDADVRFVGSFAIGDYVLHDSLFIPSPIAGSLSRISLYARILGRDRRPDAFDVARFCAVVKAAERGLRSIYPRLTFTVIVWPAPPSGDARERSETVRLINSLRKQNLDVLEAEQIVPELESRPASTAIPGDGHPAPWVHKVLAGYLVTRALSPAYSSHSSSRDLNRAKRLQATDRQRAYDAPGENGAAMPRSTPDKCGRKIFTGG